MKTVPIGVVTHVRKVKNLYKRALRNIESFCPYRPVYRYRAVLMRERFDQNKFVNMMQGRKLLEEGEQELFKSGHWHVRKFPYSPGGTAFEREVVSPDWLLDFWHPLEKEQYPEYFKTREKRKQEFIKFWEKKYNENEEDCDDDDDDEEDSEPKCG